MKTFFIDADELIALYMQTTQGACIAIHYPPHSALKYLKSLNIKCQPYKLITIKFNTDKEAIDLYNKLQSGKDFTSSLWINGSKSS
jgi:hypothetical protein